MIANIIILLWLGFLITVVVLMIRHLQSSREQYAFQNFGMVEVPYITIDIQGHPFNMVIDSGAEASMITKEALDIISYEPCTQEIILTAMNGEKVPMSTVTIPVTVNGKEISENFIVHYSDNFCQFKTRYGLVAHGILGSSFLKKVDSFINFKNHSVTFH